MDGVILPNSDVSDIKYVINFDYPNNSEDYVHRIGRTGRQDKTVSHLNIIENVKPNLPGHQLHVLHAPERAKGQGSDQGFGGGEADCARPSARDRRQIVWPEQ
jgi:superfamily II DNA/RNA helicase